MIKTWHKLDRYVIISLVRLNEKINMFNKKTIKDIDLAGKVVLLRTDYNVPLDYSDSGEAYITNDFRIRSSLDTIDYLLAQQVHKIIIISHLGRPKGVEGLSDMSELERSADGTRKYSLRPTFNRLVELLADRYGSNIDTFRANFPMNFHSMPIFSRTRYSIPMGQTDDNYKIEMLENLRFSIDEKNNSVKLAEALIQVTGADVFVQDGFGVVHRAHTSTDKITSLMPSVAGLLLEKEVSTIQQAFNNPKRPFVAVMGGAKVGDKLPLINRFIEQADQILVTGALANTILDHKGYSLGKSRVEAGQGDIIDDIYRVAEQKVSPVDNLIVLPQDLAAAGEFLPSAHRRDKPIDGLAQDDSALDIGSESIRKAVQVLDSAQTIVWNGTVGYAEFEKFSLGSRRIAEKIAQRTAKGALSIVGGGDTVSFVLDWQNNTPEPNWFSLVSTGGGAALELMSGASLPGVEALEDK